MAPWDESDRAGADQRTGPQGGHEPGWQPGAGEPTLLDQRPIVVDQQPRSLLDSFSVGQSVTLVMVAIAVVVAGMVAVVLAGRGGTLDTTVAGSATTEEPSRRPTAPPATLPSTTLPSSTTVPSTVTSTGDSTDPATQPSQSVDVTVTDDLPAPTSPADGPVAVGDRPLVDDLLGPLPQGGGELVRLTDGLDHDEECRHGQLAVMTAGVVTHLYDRPVAAATLLPGPYGQTALVEQCEEVVGPISFTNTALLPPGAAPQWVTVAVDRSIFHLDDLGWLGLTGLFGADAVFYDGLVAHTETVAFDAHDGRMTLLVDRLGTRVRHAILGVDVVVPDGWTSSPVDDESNVITITDQASSASVTVSVTGPDDGQPAPGPEPGEQADGFALVAVDLWDPLDGGLAIEWATAEAVDHRFSGPDGDRTVRVIFLDDRTVRVETVVPSSAGAVDVDVPTLASEQVRVLIAVG